MAGHRNLDILPSRYVPRLLRRRARRATTSASARTPTNFGRLHVTHQAPAPLVPVPPIWIDVPVRRSPTDPSSRHGPQQPHACLRVIWRRCGFPPLGAAAVRPAARALVAKVVASALERRCRRAIGRCRGRYGDSERPMRSFGVDHAALVVSVASQNNRINTGRAESGDPRYPACHAGTWGCRSHTRHCRSAT